METRYQNVPIKRKKRSPVLANRLFFSLSNKLKLFSSHSISPCILIQKTVDFFMLNWEHSCSQNFLISVMSIIYCTYNTHSVTGIFNLNLRVDFLYKNAAKQTRQHARIVFHQKSSSTKGREPP